MLLLCVGSCTCESISHTYRILLCAWRSCLVDMWKVASTLIQQQGWRNTLVEEEQYIQQEQKLGVRIAVVNLRLWQLHHESFVVFVILFVVKWCCSVSKNSLLHRLVSSRSNSKKIIAAEFCCCFWTWGKTGNRAPPIWCENSFPKSIFHHLQQNFIGGM